jgi:dihydrofolate reductase
MHKIPNPENDDMGYSLFTPTIDAVVMGRTTFETVLAFDIDWPYKKPVFVLSNKLKKVPEELKDSVHLLSGTCLEILTRIHKSGYGKLYIDGGHTIQNFLKEGLIDEMIITVIPIVLGGGSQLFGKPGKPIDFECVNSKLYLNNIVQNHFRKVQ